MNALPALLTPTDTAADLDGTAFTHGLGHLAASYSTGDFAGAVRLLDQVAVVADELNHHPDVQVGYGKLSFKLSSHDVEGVTDRDVTLALRIQHLADASGATDAEQPDGTK